MVCEFYGVPLDGTVQDVDAAMQQWIIPTNTDSADGTMYLVNIYVRTISWPKKYIYKGQEWRRHEPV